MVQTSFRLVYRCLAAALILSLLLLIQGCSDLPVQQLPPELSLVKIGTGQPGTPFAPSPDGTRLALVQSGLTLIDLKANHKRQLSTDIPVALTWSPAGDRLIAAFSTTGKTTLLIYGDEGEALSQVEINGTLSDMVWGSDNRITLATTMRENYSFGSTLFTQLWQWDGGGRPAIVAENSVTIKPRTVQSLGAQLDRTIKLSVSPLGDEILYTRLHDPPAVRPYMKILLRHLGTGLEREVAQTALTLGDAFLLQDDMILFSDGIHEVKLIDPWTGLTVRSLREAGSKLSVSSAGRYLLADGKLFNRNIAITTFPPTVAGLFSTDGSLFLHYQNQFHLLSGLEKEQITDLSPENRQQLLEIRKWRSQGLITHQEFLSQKKRILE